MVLSERPENDVSKGLRDALSCGQTASSDRTNDTKVITTYLEK